MTFWRLYYHLVWATHKREPIIKPEMKQRLFAHMVFKAAELNAYTYAIDGWFDHIHLVVAVPPKLAIAEVVKHLKGASAYDVNHTYGLDHEFSWQRGYGALSLGERQRASAEIYVRNQKQHHRQQTTNAWLQYSAIPDEGPTDPGLKPKGDPSGLRETPALYEIHDEFPF